MLNDLHCSSPITWTRRLAWLLVTLASLAAWTPPPVHAESWKLEDDIDYFQRYFEQNHPGYFFSGLFDLPGAVQYRRYQAFQASIPDLDDYDKFLVYYEYGVNGGGFFFYWSAEKDGECTARFVSHQWGNLHTANVQTIDCDFPKSFPEQIKYDLPSPGGIFDIGFAGLAFRLPGGTIERRFSMGFYSGLIFDGDIQKKY